MCFHLLVLWNKPHVSGERKGAFKGRFFGGAGGEAQYCELKAKRGKERTESSKSGIMSERKKRRNFLVYRLRQMDVDDKICEQIGPGGLEKIYPTEVIEQCVQGSDQWTATQRRVRQSTALGLVLFVLLLALWTGSQGKCRGARLDSDSERWYTQKKREAR